MRATHVMGAKLRFVGVLSTLALLCSLIVAPTARAHEVQPAITDLEVIDGRIQLTLDLALESYLSGINLDGLTDTDDAQGSSTYDDLRGLTPEELEQQLPELVARWSNVPLLTVDDKAAELTIDRVQIDPVGNTDLPRKTLLVLSARAAGTSVQVTWPAGAGDMVLRQQGVEDPYTGYLAGGETSPALSLIGGQARSGLGVFAEYIPVGFDHILPKGLDHILFVLGLFFLSMGLRALLWQITAFTAAHTVTLALGALGWVTVPGSIVEPLIAASIVYVAVENIFARRLNPWRPAIVFGLGLLHGLGFASVLGEFGLPEAQFIPALLGFNIGVELGQLTVIAIAFIVIGWASRRVWYRKAVAIPASCIIALVGAYWVIERTLL
ncbi:MAG: HupE/UreJ family protein [Aliishimia sp.]